MRRSRLFLLELILNLALFALCGAVCVGLLLRSAAMSGESQRLTQAVALAQSAAEALRPGQPRPQAPEGYRVLPRLEEEGPVCRASLEVLWEDQVVYTLEAGWPLTSTAGGDGP